MNTDDWLLICTVIGLVIAAVGLVFTILGHLRDKGRIGNSPQVGIKHRSGKSCYYIIMSVVILLLSGVLVWQLVQNTKPVLVFAGGGSVRSFLHEEYEVDVRKQRNSINIAMASGSAWRVLAEEYQFNETKDRKLNEFTTICLSAGEITNEFYSEYLSKLNNTIVARVFLGNDTLVTYISQGLLAEWNMLGAETISSETLVQRIQEKITNPEVIVDQESRKTRVFTTNKTSGTLEAYKKCFQDLKKHQDSIMLEETKRGLDTMSFLDTIKLKSICDSIQKRDFINLEVMIDDKKVSIFYDNMNPDNINTYTDENGIQYNREFIILGSRYYNVKDNNGKVKGKPLYLLNSKGEKIPKPMYLYFLAPKKDDNQFKIKKSVLRFLKKLEQKNDTLFKTKQFHWEKWEKEIKKKGIIVYDPIDGYDKSKPYQKLVKQIN